MSFVDNVVSDIVDTFLNGPSNWRSRLLPAITFTSPSGKEFTAKWIGGERSVDKKVGIFSFPNVKGNIVQDLDVNSSRYPISFFFDGNDCDLYGRSFFQTAKENGKWTVTHPVYGFLELQLLTIKQSDNPVEYGGVVSFESEWIEPIDENSLLTMAEALGLADVDIDSLNDSAFSDFIDSIDTATEALTNSIAFVVDGITNVVDYVLSPLFATVDAVDTAMNAINNGIQDTLNGTVLDVLSLGGQIQSLVQTPALATSSVTTSFGYYDALAEEIVSGLPDTSSSVTAAKKNEIVIKQLVLNSIIAAKAKSVTVGIKKTKDTLSSFATTRLQCISLARSIIDSVFLFSSVLDEAQSDFSDNKIKDQYFSQVLSYVPSVKLSATIARVALISAFDLRVERRFSLSIPTPSIVASMIGYSNRGTNDSSFDLFIDSNGLSGDDIYMIPRGREVVFYD